MGTLVRWNCKGFINYKYSELKELLSILICSHFKMNRSFLRDTCFVMPLDVYRKNGFQCPKYIAFSVKFCAREHFKHLLFTYTKKLCYHVHDLLGPWTLRRISTYICPNNSLKRINKYYFSLFEVSFRTIETDFSAYVQCSSYVTVFAIIPG